MLLQITAFGLSVAEIAVLVGAIFAAAEISGLSRSSRTVRKTNADLVERVDTLEEANNQLHAERSAQIERIHQLEVQIAKLEERDQGAVLAALALHENAATQRAVDSDRRHDATIAVLEDIRDRLPRAA